MKTFSIMLTIITTFMFFSSFGQTMPTTWTPSMKIVSSYGGGMAYYSYEIIITDTASHMKVLSNKGKEEYTRNFTATELNALLKFLNDHRFNKIKSDHTGPTDDKASESVMLSWEGKFIGVSESSVMSVEEEYREDFHLIQSYLQGLFGKK